MNFVLLFRGFRLDACYFFANISQTCAAIYHILKILTEWVVGNKRTSSHNNREVPFFDKKIIVNSTKQPISKNIVLTYKQQTKIDQFRATILSANILLDPFYTNFRDFDSHFTTFIGYFFISSKPWHDVSLVVVQLCAELPS